MTEPLRFITKFPYHMFADQFRQGRRPAIEKVVREIEELGYWAVSHGDHFMTQTNAREMGREGQHWGDVFCFLTYLAAITSRVKILSRIIVLPYRDPVLTAHALATLDVLSEGRLIAGVAVGGERKEFEVLRVPMKERGARTDEYIKIIRELWTRSTLDFHGTFISYEGASIMERPVQKPHPPIWIGGYSRAALRRAVELGDGWMPNSYVRLWEPQPGVPARAPQAGDLPPNISLGELRDGIAWAHDRRRELGKPPLDLSVGTGTNLNLLSNSDASGRRAKGPTEKFLTTGTPDEFVEQFQAYRDVGITCFTANFEAQDPDRYLDKARSFAKLVMGVV